MKILMIVTGIVLLLGGIGLAVLMSDSKLVDRAESMNNDTIVSLQRAEKQYQTDPSEANKKSAEAWRKNADDSGKQLESRKQTRTFGIIGGAFLAIVGLAISGLSLVFGRQKTA